VAQVEECLPSKGEALSKKKAGRIPSSRKKYKLEVKRPEYL
jgi:hypothetical protein